MNKTEAIQMLANDCIHCGGKPIVEYRTALGLTNEYDEYQIYCKCGISTEFGRDVDVLLCWNGLHQENKK